MNGEAIVLTQRAQQQLIVLNALERGELFMAQAADLLGLSVRQVRRLRAAYRRRGAHALVHGNRGRPSPVRHPPAPSRDRARSGEPADLLDLLAVERGEPVRQLHPVVFGGMMTGRDHHAAVDAEMDAGKVEDRRDHDPQVDDVSPGAGQRRADGVAERRRTGAVVAAQDGRRAVRANLRIGRLVATQVPVANFLTALGLVVVLWVGGRLVTGGVMTPGELVAFPGPGVQFTTGFLDLQRKIIGERWSPPRPPRRPPTRWYGWSPRRRSAPGGARRGASGWAPRARGRASPPRCARSPRRASYGRPTLT